MSTQFERDLRERAWDSICKCTESYWRNKIAGELDGLPRFGLIWDERLGDVIGADINGNYISRADAIAIMRGGGLG